MTDNADDKNKEVQDDNHKASDKEVVELIKALKADNERLRAEAKENAINKEEFDKLKEQIGSQSSMSELVEQLKAMNSASGNKPMTEQEKAMAELQQAADAGDMKKYRKLREAQRA